MLARLLRDPLLATIGIAWLHRRASHAWESVPVLKAPERYPGRRWPRVSIIVPARNEAARLPRLLASLRALDYPDYDIIVVDDASADATAEVAAAGGARVVRGAGPPAGWAGKNAACALGAQHADGVWLLFTDADTWHAPGSLRAAMHAALAGGADVFSLMPDQECESLPERVMLPFVFRCFFAGVSAKRLLDPSRPDAVANGQYILARRTSYDALGGHAAIPGSLIEDVALARRFKRAGLRVGGQRAGGLARVRMYSSARDVWEGFSKNSASFVALDWRQGALVALATTMSAAAPLGIVAAARARAPRHLLPALVFTITQRAWNRRFGVRPVEPAQLLAPLVTLAIAWNSGVRRLLGRGTRWKGRSYDARAVNETPLPAGVRGPAHSGLRLPCLVLLALARDLLAGRARPLERDSRAVVAALPQPPCVQGVEHIPTRGSCALAANHYQRRDFWIGWTCAVLHTALADARPDAPFELRMLADDRVWTSARTLPGARWLLGRVARAWGMTPLNDSAAPGTSLRRVARLARATREDGDVIIGLFPEGPGGGAAGLIDALPKTNALMTALGRHGLPVLPAAVWQVGERFHLRFGATYLPTGDDAAERERAMLAIARLLPPALRGVYRERLATD